ncbi:MAG: hypothetical protein AAFU79_14355 [Myxococcota bacterium]
MTGGALLLLALSSGVADLELLVEDPHGQLRPSFLDSVRAQIEGLGVSVGSPAEHELRLRAGRIAVEVVFDGKATQVPFDASRRALAEESLRQVILAGVSSTFDGFDSSPDPTSRWVLTVAGASGQVVQGVGFQLGAAAEALRWLAGRGELRFGVALFGRYLFEDEGPLPGGGTFGVRELMVGTGVAANWSVYPALALEIRLLLGFGRTELRPRAGEAFGATAPTETLQGLGRGALGVRVQMTEALSVVLSGALEVLPSGLDLQVDGRTADRGGEFRPAFDLGLSVHF